MAEEDEFESGAAADRRLRRLRRLVTAMTAGLFAVMIITLTGIAFKLAQGPDDTGEGEAAAPYNTALPLKPGEIAVEMQADRGRLYLLLEDTAKGSARVLVVDPGDGSVEGEMRLAPIP